MKRSHHILTLALVCSLLVMPAHVAANDLFDKVVKKFKEIDQTTLVIGGVVAGIAALAGFIWWLASDRRSDEQVIIDAQRMAHTNATQYENIMRLLEQARISSNSNDPYYIKHTVINEQLLSQCIAVGVDQEYIRCFERSVEAISKEIQTLSKRMEKAKIHEVRTRMKVVQDDLLQLRQNLAHPLQQFLRYHAAYFDLYKIAEKLQHLYAYPSQIKTSQKKLVQYVAEQSSAFALYPYCTYVEKIERDVQQLKSDMRQATYAKHTSLMHVSQELCENLLIIKGTLASSSEYLEDVKKRERDRIRQEQERERQAQQLAQQQRELQLQAERERAQLAKQAQSALEQQILQQVAADRVAAENQRIELAAQKALERERQRQQQLQAQKEAQERARQEAERQLAQQQAQLAAYNEWARQQAYQQTQAYPSAPPAYEPQVPAYVVEPSAPPYEEPEQEKPAPVYQKNQDEDLDAQFDAMIADLDFETGETEQFQKDHEYMVKLEEKE